MAVFSLPSQVSDMLDHLNAEFEKDVGYAGKDPRTLSDASVPPVKSSADLERRYEKLKEVYDAIVDADPHALPEYLRERVRRSIDAAFADPSQAPTIARDLYRVIVAHA